jgi:branched-chain amino acid transport system permease protein
MSPLAVRWLRKLDLLLVAGAFLALLPIFHVQRTTDFVIFCVYVLAFDLLYGHMGRLSFGHMLYLGTGAYAAALSSTVLSGNPFLALAVALAAGGAIGVLLGPIIVRTTGAAFALINLAFNQVGYFAMRTALAQWTGGEDGTSAFFARVGPFNPSNRAHMFALALLSLLGTLWLVRRISRAPSGILLRSIREKEERVRFIGYDLRRAKFATFVLSTTLAAFAGGLSTLNYTFVNPSFVDPSRNVEVIFAALIGGAGSPYGAVIGGVAFMTISNYLPNYVQRWEMFLGLSLVLLVFRFRAGLWGSLVSRLAPRGEALAAPEVRP